MQCTGGSGRSDGIRTKDAILDAAGRVFAEHGFEKATVRTICDLAGVNVAAVNYHFGGKENLYMAALVAAHRQLATLEDIAGIASSPVPPREKIRALYRLILRASQHAPGMWGMRLLLRQMTSEGEIPAPLLGEVLPKISTLRAIVAGITGLSPDSDRLKQAAALLVLPCMPILIFSGKMDMLVPGLHSDAFLDAMTDYAAAGLTTLKPDRG